MSRILLIEDNPLVRSVLSELLADSGHTVIEAGDGKEGLRLFQLVDPELVITDLVMPEVDGIEVLMKLRMYPRRSSFITAPSRTSLSEIPP